MRLQRYAALLQSAMLGSNAFSFAGSGNHCGARIWSTTITRMLGLLPPAIDDPLRPGLRSNSYPPNPSAAALVVAAAPVRTVRRVIEAISQSIADRGCYICAQTILVCR